MGSDRTERTGNERTKTIKWHNLYPNVSISIFNEMISRHQVKIGGVD